METDEKRQNEEKDEEKRYIGINEQCSAVYGA
jgi:hypothetical protein